MTQSLSELIAALIAAKEAEEAAKANRIECELGIAEILKGKEGSSSTFDVENYKIVVKRPIRYVVNWELFDAVIAVNANKPPPMRNKPMLDERGLKWTKENDPKFYEQLSKAITTKPGKPSVTVKEI